MKTITITFLAILFTGCSCRSFSKDDPIEKKITMLFEKQAGKKHNINGSIFMMHSDSRNIHLKLSYSPDQSGMHSPDRSFHVASIGKTFTSVLVAILVEEGVLRYEDPVSQYLDPDILEGLFVVKGTDYSSDVRIHHLLNHTSGAADFYTDKPGKGPTIMEMMVLDPDRMWTIPMVIGWTKDNLNAHFPPGEGFHYSDTGYEMLGLIIENATGKAFELNLHEKVFDPLGMKHSYLMFYSRPEEESQWPMCDLYYKGLNLTRTNSASFNRAAGGVVTNTEDLLKFIRAIHEYRIISKTSFELMQNWQKFGPGIDYGYGLMRFRFIGAPEKYMILGNSGSIGTYMYYNPVLDTYFIGTFNHVNYQRQPIMLIFKIMRVVFKMG